MADSDPDIERLQAFDDGEWLGVERAYAGRLFAYVARRVPDAQAREDIVQESFLGAVRGIGSFDKGYTFEQYLFGICRNRTIDHLRRRKATTLSASEDDDERSPLESLAEENETPSAIVAGEDVRGQGRTLLVEILRDWVQETWEAKEFTRLMVIEALFAGGWRNRDTWKRFGLRDETAVAGIKFRALKRMRELAARLSGAAAQGAAPDSNAAAGDPESGLLTCLADEAEAGHTGLDVAMIWRRDRVSCPARHWLARHQAGTLSEGPRAFVDFHTGEMACEWCLANQDDLTDAHEDDLEPLLERVRASTAQYLRSKTVPGQ